MAKFKIGDQVRIVAKDKNNTTGWKGGNYDWHKPETFNGLVGYIVEIGGTRPYQVHERKGSTSGTNYLGLYADHEIELLTEYTPNTPKVGDRYRVLKDMPGYKTFGRCKKDRIVTLYTDHNLTTDEHRPLWVTDDFGVGYNLAANDLTTEYLELVEEPRYMKAEFDIEPVFTTIKQGQIIKADLKDISVTPEPIKKTIIQKTMNAFKKALLSVDTKTLIKAGYMDDETLELTNKGQQALNFIVYEKYQKELVAAAEADIAEAEAKKK